MFKENPETHAPTLLRNSPLAPATPGLPKELSSIFNLIKGSKGAIHLIILGILILNLLTGQAK